MTNSIMRLTLLLTTAFFLTFSHFSCAKDRVFGLVSKSLDDPNFTRAWQGCDATAQKFGDKCVLIGGVGPSNPREQMYALKKAISHYQFDVIALTVTKSDYLAKELSDLKIPLITYDSDFSKEYRHVRRAYVGIDNHQIGMDVAHLAQKLYPNGGSVCLMTAMPDPNLKERLLAIRRTLSGDDAFPEQQILKGENGWTECSRSPWNTADDQKRTLSQISYTLGVIKPDLLITTGHWPIVDTADYLTNVEPFAAQLHSGKTKVLIGGIGESSGIDSLLKRQLLHGYIQVDFFDIGEQCYRVMSAIAEGKPVATDTRVKNTVHSILDQ